MLMVHGGCVAEPETHLKTAPIFPHMTAMATPGERERVDAAAADAAQRLRGKVMAGLSCKAEEAPGLAGPLLSRFYTWLMVG
jgi:hypothetical protein